MPSGAVLVERHRQSADAIAALANQTRAAKFVDQVVGDYDFSRRARHETRSRPRRVRGELPAVVRPATPLPPQGAVDEAGRGRRRRAGLEGSPARPDSKAASGTCARGAVFTELPASHGSNARDLRARGGVAVGNLFRRNTAVARLRMASCEPLILPLSPHTLFYMPISGCPLPMARLLFTKFQTRRDAPEGRRLGSKCA